MTSNRIEEGNTAVDVKTKSSGNLACWKFTTVLFFLATACLAGFTVYHYAYAKEHQNEGLDAKACVTPTCIVAAAQILQAMNKSVDPCDNFYDYACGRWGQENPVEEGEIYNEVFIKITKSVDRKIKAIISEPILASDSESIRKTKDTFTSCMDLKYIAAVGVKPLQDHLDSHGGWPIVVGDKWDGKKVDIFELMVAQKLDYMPSFFESWVSLGREKYQYAIGPVSSIFPIFIYQNTKFYDAFVQLIQDVAMLLGAKGSDLKKQASEMIKFELQVNMDLLSKFNRSYNEEIEYSELKKLYPKIKWDILIEKTFDSQNIKIDPREKINMFTDGNYLANLTTLIERTDKRIIVNYMLLRNMLMGVSFLDEKIFEEAVDKFIKSVSGSSSREVTQTEKKCLKFTRETYKWPVGRMYVNKYFDYQAKETAYNMIDKLRDAFKQMLNKVDWMDQKSINTAKEKADAISSHIGYPDFILDNDKLDSYYSMIRIEKNTYFENWRSIRRYLIADNLKKLGQKESTSDWDISPSEVNAFYHPFHNRISFPAAILQIPFYHKNYPKYLNFAGIGFIIGHEITHGFDNQGRKFDKDGQEHIWWSKEVTKKYKQRIQCYVQQYDNFTMKGTDYQVDGLRTLNENLADNGAIKESFLAYKNYIKDELHGKSEKLLPGFEKFTQEQLFFINVAQPWCSTVSDKSYWYKTSNDPHAKGRFRILGTMANSKDFSKAFNCKKGTKMNPVKKCKLW